MLLPRGRVLGVGVGRLVLGLQQTGILAWADDFTTNAISVGS